jgi:hypothetical protein
MNIAYIAGKTAFLPMDPYEAEQFLYGLGLDGPGAEHGIESVNDFRCPFSQKMEPKEE